MKEHSMLKWLWLLAVSLFILNYNYAQAKNFPKGNLFIIGGGDRPLSLMKKLMDVAQLKPSDYIVVLPMATEYPDTAFFYAKEDLKQAGGNRIFMLNFDSSNNNNVIRTDSIRNAKLIFITGGDQNRFMKIAAHSMIEKAIQDAYENGSTIAGTSAGASVMSAKMITGNQLTDTSAETFTKILLHNAELKQGLGLLQHEIIDQHFIVRSRYNRMFSIAAENPEILLIGIDESTAIIVHKNKAVATGENQVVVLHTVKGIHSNENKIGIDRVQLSIYLAGATFALRD